jgi:hypothetical protein
MPLPVIDDTLLVLEDGSGYPNANTYVTLADAERFFLTRFKADNWNNASTQDKVQALVTAAYGLDIGFIWKGNKYVRQSNLMWPRTWVIDPDNTQAFFPQITRPNYLPANEIPLRLKKAQMLLALRCLGSFAQTALTGNQPYADPPVRRLALGQGALEMDFEEIKMPAAGMVGLIDDEIASILAGMGVRRHGNKGAVIKLRRGM